MKGHRAEHLMELIDHIECSGSERPYLADVEEFLRDAATGGARNAILAEIRECQANLDDSPFAGRPGLMLSLAKVALSKVGPDPVKSRGGLIQAIALLLSLVEFEETR